MVLKKFYYLKFWNKFLRIIEVIIFSIKKKKNRDQNDVHRPSSLLWKHTKFTLDFLLKAHET